MSAWLLRARGLRRARSSLTCIRTRDGAARVYTRLGFVEVAGFDVYVDLA